MATFDDYLRQSFPNIRITSGARNPNSRLGRANPRSWHNQGKAWDTAPVEGMTYDQYVDRIKKDGWDVLEARDEVKNPSKHATGPHWHVAVGRRKEPQVNGLASLFGQRPNYQTPPYNPGPPQGLAELLGQGAIQPQIPQMQAPQANLPKPGAFAKGGKGWEIMGIIGDALQTAGGGQATYAPYVMNQRDLETQGRQKLEQMIALQQQKRAEREQALEDQKTLIKYRTENEGPTNAARMAEEAGFQPGTPQYQQAILQYMQRPVMIGGEAYGYAPQPQQSGGIAPGTVEDGYVFVGGDPANPASWRQQ
jgi:hypothetical protein